MTTSVQLHGFILSRHARDTASGLQFDYWLATDSGAVCVQQQGQERVCFIAQQQAAAAAAVLSKAPYQSQSWRLQPIALRGFDGDEVVALYTSSNAIGRELEQRLQASGIVLMEVDIRPHERYLMERFITGAMTVNARQGGSDDAVIVNAKIQSSDFKPTLKVASVDIETTMDGKTIHSIAVFSQERLVQSEVLAEKFSDDQAIVCRKVWLHWPQASVPVDLPSYTSIAVSERQMLRAFVQWVEFFDPDVFIGWSVVQFDFQILCQRARDLGVRLRLGRGGEEARWQAGQQRRPARLYMPGRVALDGIEVMRAATWQFESFALEHVAQKLLGRGKDIVKPHERGTEIQRLYQESPAALVRYNLEDCRLVWDIFIKADLINFSLARSQLTGLPLDRIGGSAQAFDHLYLPRLHRAGWVAPAFASGHPGQSPGGYVMDSLPGLYDQVLVFDFKSLYPSIIRTFLIDPLGLITGPQQEDSVDGFKRARFSRRDAILPDIIARLWEARDQAKAEANLPLATSIKIVMNSCYGVLGSTQCRFFDQRLASSITQRGHQILQKTKTMIEQQGYQVIYGDTDSVFVHWRKPNANIADVREQGHALATWLNEWWREYVREEFDLTSYLEIEFETLFRRFLMPTVRGQEVGSKKRYAGIIVSPKNEETLLFKGLESVRTDWTPMARELQQALYEKVFHEQDYVALIINTEQQIRDGLMDNKLVYRKRIRRPLVEYQKNIPPHVQAAYHAESWLAEHDLASRYGQGGWIEYVMTTTGPRAVDVFDLSVIPDVYAEGRDVSAGSEQDAWSYGQYLDYDHYVERQLIPIVDGILNILGDSYDCITNKQLGLF